MILRAVGYDKNNEFTGADWALHVAQIAEQNKILKNVKGIDLSAPASRELVAELLFQAIQVPTVTYTAAFGYQDVSLTADKKTDKLVKANSSLGYKNFKLVSGDDSDIWGRPTTVWAKDANDNGEYDVKKDTTVYATIVATPDASFNVATTQCDICEALKEKKSATIVDTYTNGVLDTKDATYSATETKKTVGAQGEQIEFYQNADGDYRLVVIDTYLAYVNEVVAEKTDAKGHVVRDAYLALDGFTTKDANSTDSKKIETLYVKGNDYAEGDWLLVNVNEVDTTQIVLTSNKKAEDVKTVEVVGKAESFEGAQTEIWSKAYKHTIDKKDYDDAVKFFLDEAGTTETAKFTWFLDQFGNLIGSAAITSDSYAVLEDIIWIPGKDDHAEATLVYMDGKEETVTVDKIDGLSVEGRVSKLRDGEFYGDFSAELKGSETRQGDTYTDVKFVSGVTNYAYVSTSGSSNDAYKGMALYLVETNKDGSVNLTSADVEYLANATVNPESNLLKDGKYKYALNANTKFLVRDKNDDGKYVYTAKTLKELDKYMDESAEIYYTVGANQIVTNVYVKKAIDAASMSQYIFVPNAATSNVKWIVEDQAFKVKVYVKGEEQYVLASAKIAATLSENAGKLFAAEWYTKTEGENVYGSLKSVDLVNEHTDSEFLKNTTGVDYVTGKKFDGDMLTSYTDYAKTSVENNWDLSNAVIINANGEKVDVAKLSAGDGIWIVSEKTEYSSKGLYAYVGEMLSNNTELSATYKTTEADAKDVALTFDAKNEAKVSLGGGVKAASAEYTAENVNAYVVTPVDGKWLTKTDSGKTTYLKGAGNVTYITGEYTAVEDASNGSINSGDIIVVAEDGVTTETYTITVTNTAHSCANVAVKEGLKFGLAWGGENNADLVLNLNGNKTLTGADLKAAIYVPCTVDTGKVCEGATIVIYDTMKDADHILKDGQDLVAMKGASDLFAVVTAANGQTWSFNITIAD